MTNTSKTVIQTANVLIEEKENAENYARSQGFDSLQTALRFLIRKMANHELKFGVSAPLVSPDVEKQIAMSLKEREKLVDYNGSVSDLITN